MASYPTSAKSFTTRSSGQTIGAAHMNDVQDEINAMETALLSSGLAHHLLFVDATYDIGASGSTRPRDLFLSRNATVGGTLAVTGVATLTAQATLTAGYKTTSGNCYIGDDANASMTLGLTINQGAADNEILAFKSSDVTHAITAVAEADTFGLFNKADTSAGGARLLGLSSGEVALALWGEYTTDDTGKATTANGAIEFNSAKANGAPGTNANLVVFRSDATTRFIFDAEGSAHADVEWIAFDTHDDVALLDALDSRMSKRHSVTNAFGEALRYNADALHDAGIVNFYDTGPRAMVNFTRLAMLHTGALRQLGRQQALLTRALLMAGVVTQAQLEAA